MRPLALVLVVLAGVASGEAGAQMVGVTPGAVEIVVPLAGTTFGTGTDASTQLVWQGVQDYRTKITVSTLVVSQDYTLTVRAQGVSRGKSAGVVTLTGGMSAADLVVDINSGNWRNRTGGATLRYQASAPGTGSAPPPAGQDVHTVVFTLTQQ